MIALKISRSDSSALAFALYTATTIIAHQVAGKATRDALFLSYYDVTQLPKVVIAAAVLSMLGVMTMARFLARHGPGTLVPTTFGVSGLLFLGEWVLFAVNAKIAAVVLYLHMAIFGAILISGFWSVVNERFDPHSAKRTIARVAAAATLGGVLGGVIAERVASLIDVRAMLLVLSGLHLVCVIGVAGIGRGEHQARRETRVRSGLRIIARTTYLQQMGFLVVLVATLAALVDYAFKAEASARFESSEDLVTFFAGFYATVGVLTFAVQTVLGPRMLQRFGIGTTIAVLPAVVFVGGIAGALVSHLWTLVAVRGSQAVFAHSFFRSSFELLYTPLPPSRKRPTKTIIDVASDRLGDMVGGGLILLLLAILPSVPSGVVLAFASLAAAIALYVVTRLHRGYVQQLARNLREGSVYLGEDEVVDATTQHILAETTAYGERELLMARIEERRKGKSPGRSPDREPRPDGPGVESAGPRVVPQKPRVLAESDRFGAAVRDLTSGDHARIGRALRGEFMDIRLAPYLISLLGDDRVAVDARMELRWMAPRIIGQLTDALLEPDQPLLARQRLPSVLEVCHNPRSVSGLLAGLVDEEFNVRYSCARALARMRRRDKTLAIPRQAVFDAVRREVEIDAETWTERTLTIETALPADGPEDPGPELPKVNRSLEHVFTVLSLALDRDALQLSLQAVYSTDRNLRGTALEYLENVLPDDIRTHLWRHIGVSGRQGTPRRSRRAILTDLKGGIDLPASRRR